MGNGQAPVPKHQASNANNILLDKNFEVICAIDIGTDGVGMAYSVPPDADIILHEWKKRLAVKYMKQKTRLLLDNNTNLKVFGEGAYKIMLELDEIAQDNWKLIDKLKKVLYHDPRWKDAGFITDNIKVDLNTKVTAIDGTEFDTEKVIIETFTYLKKEAIRFIKAKLLKINIKTHDIQWIISIPAVWSIAAKTELRNMAVKAGLISRQSINQLRLISESECAALHVQYLLRCGKLTRKFHGISTKSLTCTPNAQYYCAFKSKQQEEKDSAASWNFHHYELSDNNEELSSVKSRSNERIINYDIKEDEKKADITEIPVIGDKYILIDAGAYKVDILSHQIINDFGVRQVLPARGGAFGSYMIDDEMMNILHELFSEELMIKCKDNYGQFYHELLENMQWTKCQFDIYSSTVKYHWLELPMPIINYFE
eukprot:490994_1